MEEMEPTVQRHDTSGIYHTKIGIGLGHLVSNLNLGMWASKKVTIYLSTEYYGLTPFNSTVS